MEVKLRRNTFHRPKNHSDLLHRIHSAKSFVPGMIKNWGLQRGEQSAGTKKRGHKTGDDFCNCYVWKSIFEFLSNNADHDEIYKQVDR